jgi:hypothetical protein
VKFFLWLSSFIQFISKVHELMRILSWSLNQSIQRSIQYDILEETSIFVFCYSKCSIFTNTVFSKNSIIKILFIFNSEARNLMENLYSIWNQVLEFSLHLYIPYKNSIPKDIVSIILLKNFMYNFYLNLIVKYKIYFLFCYLQYLDPHNPYDFS